MIGRHRKIRGPLARVDREQLCASTPHVGRDVHPDVAVDKLIRACSVDPPVKYRVVRVLGCDQPLYGVDGNLAHNYETVEAILNGRDTVGECLAEGRERYYFRRPGRAAARPMTLAVRERPVPK
jgi:hypothetical protein